MGEEEGETQSTAVLESFESITQQIDASPRKHASYTHDFLYSYTWVSVMEKDSWFFFVVLQ